MEEQIDSEMKKMDEMDDDDIEKIRQKRLKAMQRAHAAKQEFIAKGHGGYDELPSEKDFFDKVKDCKRAVVHFYRPTTLRCEIFGKNLAHLCLYEKHPSDKHLALLAPKHVETRFVKLNAEKCPFLCERLNIRVIPTLLLIVDGKTQVEITWKYSRVYIFMKEKIVGFDQLGGHDEFSTEMLEWRLGVSKAINYRGDVNQPPEDKRAPARNPLHANRRIRQADDFDTDEELFGDD